MTSVIRPDAWRERWASQLVPYGTMTGDRRLFEPGSLTVRTLPVPLMLQVRTAQGHFGSVVVGFIDEVTQAQDAVSGAGSWLDPELVPEVGRALALMEGRVAPLSVDLEPDMVVDVPDVPDEPLEPVDSQPRVRYRRARIAGATIVPMAAFDQPSLAPEVMFGQPVQPPASELALTGTSAWQDMPAQPRETVYNADEAFKRILAWADGNDAKARGMFLWFDPQGAEGTRDRFRLPIGDVLDGRPALNFHAVYAAAALVSGAHGGLPTVSDVERGKLRRAISDIYGRLSKLFDDPELVAPWDQRRGYTDVKATSLDSLAASAAPVAPPDAWFDDPEIADPSPTLTVTPQGRVYGYLAPKGSCHRAIQAMTGQCFTPPPSPSKLQRFMDGSLVASSGKTIKVGRVTACTMHAEAGATADAAKAHYDHTGTCAAVVRAGEDDYGIWLAGALVPEATPEQVAMLRRSPLSGDWRRHGDEGLDLVAALAVNTAGFPAPISVRQLAVDGGECASLVASGPVSEEGEMTVDGMAVGATGGDSPQAVETAVDAAVGTGDATGQRLDVDLGAVIQQVTEQVIAGMQERSERTERLATLITVAQHERDKRLAGMAAFAITTAERQQAAKAGEAMPDGSFPVRNADDLKNAVKAVGRAGADHDKVRAFIIRRSKALKVPFMVPSSWAPDGSLKTAGK
jgi:hypothetical protein